jgi:hypothetical protein
MSSIQAASTLAAAAIEMVVFAKCIDSWTGTQRAGPAILREAGDGQEEERSKAEDRSL